jgi:hypothetical protein
VSQDEDDIGTVAEEAAKLLGALSSWARDVDEHVATGAAECTYCPVCRTVHVLRQTSPEVRAHLTTAATSLVKAAAGLLATAVPDDRREPGGVQHIDLDEDTDEDTDGDAVGETDPEEGDR